MKIAVTGGSGFIGGYVVDSALRSGHEVLVVDTADRRRSAEGYSFPDSVELMLADVRDENAITEVAAHVDGFVHLAACLGTQETIQNPKPSADVNITGTLNVLGACRQYDLPMSYISVGNHKSGLNSYTISKVAAERYCEMYRKELGTRVNIVRAVNAYGPRQRVAEPFGPGKVRKIIPAFVCRALLDMPIEVYGDGEQISDMVWVGDVANCLVHCLELGLSGTALDYVVECGPAGSNTVNEVAEMIIAETGSKGGIVHLPMRPGEPERDVVKANVATMMRCGFPAESMRLLRDGIKETVAWYASELGVSWNRP